MIFADAHVHMYDCFDVNSFFDSAWKNFESAVANEGCSGADVSYVLLLTEGKTESWFQQQVTKKSSEQKSIQVSTEWEGIFSSDNQSIMVYRREHPEKKLYLAAGHQLVTAERIEVLALFCGARVDDGLSLEETVTSIQQTGGIPVLPWGAGKWLGTRGKLLHDFFENQDKGIFLGDNGGRPGLWPTPPLFALAQKKALPLISGTDPLPLPDEADRAGSFGFFIFIQEECLQENDPTGCLKKNLLSQKIKKYPFGSLQKNSRFCVNQLRLRLVS